LLALLNCGRGEVLSSTNSPLVECRVAHGDYEFFSNVDSELRELEQAARRNDFVLEWNWDGQDFVYTREQLSPGDYAAFLARCAGRVMRGATMSVEGLAREAATQKARKLLRQRSSTCGFVRKNILVPCLLWREIYADHAGLSHGIGFE
jgi:hypothetical protein